MLRRSVLGLLALSTFTLAGCDLTGPDRELVVDLFGPFQDTPVRVEVDGRPLLDEAVTTGQILATAGIIDVPGAGGEHHVRVVVDGAASAEIIVHTDTTVTVWVKYDANVGAVRLESLPERIGHR